MMRTSTLWVLQHAQQLDLHRQRHVADFIEEQRAAIGQFETSGAAGDCAGEGALLVTEQFAFEQLGRNRPAIDRHERRFAALGMVMQVARNHFLASSGLTENQHAGIRVGDLLHHLADVLNRPAGADEAAEKIGLAMTTALARLVVHLAIDLGTVQRIEQFAVARRHFEGGKDPATLVFRQVNGRIIAH
jgi:hypothetical protein